MYYEHPFVSGTDDETSSLVTHGPNHDEHLSLGRERRNTTALSMVAHFSPRKSRQHLLLYKKKGQHHVVWCQRGHNPTIWSTGCWAAADAAS